HTAGRVIGAAYVGQRRLSPGVLLGVVVFPFNVDGAVVAGTVQLDHDLFQTVSVAGGPSGDEVPAVELVAKGAIAAQEAGAGVLADHLHALDVGTVNPIAIFADELDHRYALPFHVRAVQVEADLVLVAGLIECLEVVAGGFEIAHSALARMAFEIKGGAVLLASIKHRAET